MAIAEASVDGYEAQRGRRVPSGDDPKAWGLTVFVRTITPGIAAEWLKANLGNRPVKQPAIEQYCRDMRAGAWDLTGETIIFDSTGALRNGQNRLMACIRAGVPFTSVVVCGIDPKAFRSMDNGTRRSSADLLAIAGTPNAVAVAATCVHVWRWERGMSLTHGGGASSPTKSEMQQVLSDHPTIEDSVKIVKGMPRGNPPAVNAFLHWLFSQIDSHAADLFMSKLSTGAGLELGDPILVLRQRLERSTAAPRTVASRLGALSVPERIALTIKAWNFWRVGEHIRFLKWSSSEAMPTPR